MIISRTPFRISFAGGGTDLPSFYRGESGAVVSTAIDKYMYLTVNKYFDDSIILKYSRTEEVPAVSKIQHPLIREAMRSVGIPRGIEITSMADVVGGTGLGSSSSFTVGLLHALYAYRGRYVTAAALAREACRIEIDRVREPIGKQDQYIAAYGGFQYIEFLPDEGVKVTPIICPPERLRRLNGRLMLFYTGKTRKAGRILGRLKSQMKGKRDDLREIKGLADAARRELQQGSIDDFGRILHEGWRVKRGLSRGVSSAEIDGAYARARKAGALGGKVLGAGGGGFLMLYAPKAAQAPVRRAMRDWREIPFKFESEGSKIIHVG
ncbi:MAG: GHMP kinase [Elusimicrobia bacterium CG1_02_63_36]|nr:MAG: GHMP kinase [Elusimicrobia bacterium CG1_02_63_36]PIP82301.1 MAG: GHMP kinase [Elusimicrobia bacterium CG22_combo_CG10-13_8_21_14_all_63_91]PJA15283.1 MAG: GHMP kinase [Elusimicrobia bacterium CG_4_10_14_0_2_um_filter_63_34]PJB27034.1 MAG: GHMP kinase [Elusimicrobia bacterium CG_4_9_14_3_um_filter_62_55]